MAFPVPDHLPKRAIPVDVSSKILHKVDATTKDTLSSSLAASWIAELDESIQATKQRVHDRIQTDFPTFHSQLEISKSVQSRLQSLTSRVNELDATISDPQTGLVPTLLSTLKKHSALLQEASDTTATYQGLAYLLRCRDSYTSLIALVQEGNLPDAVIAGRDVEELLEGMPQFLQQTNVALDLRNKFNSAKAWVQDQLSDAFSRSVIVSPTEIKIYHTVQVRQSQTMLQLPAILHSLSPASTSNHLSTLRRDILAHFVDHVLKQPYAVLIETSLIHDARLSLIPAPPNNEDLCSRLNNVSTVLGFLYSQLIPHLPSDDAAQLTRSLSKAITSSVLNNFLMPTLPSSFGLLPSYLTVLKRAVVFEEKDISRLLESDKNEGSIKAWSDGVSGHYERRRRIEILELARKEILEPETSNDIFEAFSEGGPETSLPSAVPVQMDNEDIQDDAWGFDEPATASTMNSSTDGLGLDEPVTSAARDDTADGWGFDDELEPESEQELAPEPEAKTPTDSVPADYIGQQADVEPDPADAWGWNEEDDLPAEDIPEASAWDDPWADPPESDTIPGSDFEPTLPSPPINFTSPRAATRLEKLASKHKKHVNGNSLSNSPAPSPLPPPLQPQVTFVPSSPDRPEHNPPPKSSRLNPGKRPAAVITTVAPKEIYRAPKRIKRIIKMVEIVIDESKLFFASNLFGSTSDEQAPAPGTILLQAAASILDLYQALYPIKFLEELKSPEKAMLFSNSCIYMSGAVQRIEDTIYGQPVLKEKLTECRHRLQVLGDSWFEDTVEDQCNVIDIILTDGAQGFTYTGDQDRYDECEMAVNEALKTIKRLAQRLKGVLTKTKYYTALGIVAEAALSRILRDILALPDIPEIESHRLSELCRILNSMEGLFSDNPNQPSFVVGYVPSWLKFSYLSELLEASLADITYLFEQGALVDFQVDEIVNLLRALFADTPLRTNTISNVLGQQSP
ncbi:hypothetical protein BDN70DRAFT_880982 [Pholiota conissans]|uniref:ZW10 C-terminal helical domain-containing protein n=1 Tax=Pholiota conissans TaxID=109636 RepID=A0A9P5Z0R5_9AGAR|nr:hypothetical protein BDN70DRAFT_880982 [Pholiota conissans]